MSTDGPVAINIVVNRDPNPTTHVIKHVLRNGTGVIRKKRAEGYSRSKNAARMREKRKDPEYRKRENERRKLQQREERAREKKDCLLRIPNRSVLSEMPAEVTNRTGTTLHNYTARKDVKTIQVTTYTQNQSGRRIRKIHPTTLCTRLIKVHLGVRGVSGKILLNFYSFFCSVLFYSPRLLSALLNSPHFYCHLAKIAGIWSALNPRNPCTHLLLPCIPPNFQHSKMRRRVLQYEDQAVSTLRNH